MYYDFCTTIPVGLINFSKAVYSVEEAETKVSVQLLLSFDGFNRRSQSIEVEFMTMNVTAQGNIVNR